MGVGVAMGDVVFGISSGVTELVVGSGLGVALGVTEVGESLGGSKVGVSSVAVSLMKQYDL